MAAGRLTLSVVCDIDPSHPRALEIASLITAPIRLLPQLRDCRIRLGNTPNPRLQAMAREAALYACRPSPPRYKSAATPPSPPHFTPRPSLMTLPRELSIRILEYTDLVAPGREVTWSRQDHRYVMHRFHEKVLSDHLHLRPLVRCWEQLDDTVSPFACFCHCRHASFTQLCRCWAPPGPTLFLICRTWCQDAQFVFTRNRFVVHEYLDHPPWAAPYLPLTEPEMDVETEEVELRGPLDQAKELGTSIASTVAVGGHDYLYHRLAVSQFLRDVVPVHCLNYLRFLELVFPQYLAPTWPQDQHPAIQDWRSTIDWVQDKVNGAALAIRLGTVKRGMFSPDTYGGVISQSNASSIHDAHMTLVQSLKPLINAGVSRVYIRLTFPWAMTETLFGKNQLALDVLQLTKQRNKEAEQLVLGAKFQDLYAKWKGPTECYWYPRYHGLY